MRFIFDALLPIVSGITVGALGLYLLTGFVRGHQRRHLERIHAQAMVLLDYYSRPEDSFPIFEEFVARAVHLPNGPMDAFAELSIAAMPARPELNFDVSYRGVTWTKPTSQLEFQTTVTVWDTNERDDAVLTLRCTQRRSIENVRKDIEPFRAVTPEPG